MKWLALILTLISASAQDIFVPYFDSGTLPNNLLSGLIACWRFDEGTGNAPSSPAGNTLIQSSANPPGNEVPGIVQNGRNFSAGVPDTFTWNNPVLTGDDFASAGPWTMAFWVGFSDPAPGNSGGVSFLTKGSYGSDQLSWRMGAYHDKTFTVGDDIWFAYSSTGTPEPDYYSQYLHCAAGNIYSGGWRFIVARWNGTTINISLTEESDIVVEEGAFRSYTAGFFNSNQGLVFGQDAGQPDRFRGGFDEFEVWNRYLSDCEIAWLFYKQRLPSDLFSYPDFNSIPCMTPPEMVTETKALTSFSGTTTIGNYTGRRGFRFTPSVNMKMTRLGRYRWSGNVGVAKFNLCKFPSGEVIMPVNIDLSVKLTGQIGYSNADATVTLLAGQQYALVEDVVNGGNIYATTGNTFTFNTTHLSNISAVQGAPAGGGNDVLSDVGGGANKMFGPIDFKYILP